MTYFKNFSLYGASFIGWSLVLGWVLFSTHDTLAVAAGGLAAIAGFVLVHRVMLNQGRLRKLEYDNMSQETEKGSGAQKSDLSSELGNRVSSEDYETAVALHSSFESFPIAVLRQQGCPM